SSGKTSITMGGFASARRVLSDSGAIVFILGALIRWMNGFEARYRIGRR
ncbi:MAG: hypothetical protein ACI92G_003541, partial [Candidatus Pelagisphaera sp.]